MTTYDDACRQVVEQTKGGLACGVVDLESGALLGTFHSAREAQISDRAAAATKDLFCGGPMGTVDDVVRKHRDVPPSGERHFQEIHITSSQGLHFAKMFARGKAAIMLVTEKSTNIGMGWAQLKSAIAQLEPLVDA